VSVPVIVLVEEHGLVQLQFEFASDINAESHVDFSWNSRRLLKEIWGTACGAIYSIASSTAIVSMPSHKFCRRRFSFAECWLLS
jgi:hypothetical protein